MHFGLVLAIRRLVSVSVLFSGLTDALDLTTIRIRISLRFRFRYLAYM